MWLIEVTSSERLIFLVCHCPSLFLGIKFFSKLNSSLFGVFEKVGLILKIFRFVDSVC